MDRTSNYDIQGGILEPDDPNFERTFRQLNVAGALFRVNHHFVERDLPDKVEQQIARETPDKSGWEVDCIITHCCPSSIQDIVSVGMYQQNTLTDFLDEIQECCRFQY